MTFQSAISPIFGGTQNKLAFKDEINVFRRTLLHAGLPGSSRWYDVTPDGAVGARATIYLRRKDGVSGGDFRTFFKQDFIPTLASTGVLTELRTQSFLPWIKKLWDTPDVAHDNPRDQRLHASVILGFTDETARARFFTGDQVASLSASLARSTSAVHAYDVEAALTYVKKGVALPHNEQ